MKENNLQYTITHNDELSPAKLFAALFGTIPNMLYINEVKCKKFLAFLIQGQEEKPDIQFKEKYFDSRKRKARIGEQTFIWSTKEMLAMKGKSLIYLYEKEQLFSEQGLMEKAKIFKASRKNNTPQIKLIIPGPGGPSLQLFDCESFPTDITLNYNDDLAAFHEEFIQKLDDPRLRGLHFLYGKPGTGKTNYLRHILSKIKKDVIYIPSGMAEVLSYPEFLKFLIRAKGDVLIIEDDEKAIISRENSYNNAVSTLLNISDGLLSDVLNMQIICTFNTDLRNVDKALLRPGRLLSRYEFSPLAPAKAEKLSASLDLNQTYGRPTTLAEVYAGRDSEEVSLNTQRSLGFKA